MRKATLGLSLLLGVGALVLSACGGGASSGSGNCGGGCPAGQLCVDNQCRDACLTDDDCGAAGLICGNNVCIDGVRSDAPVVSELAATGSADAASGHLAAHYDGFLLVRGAHLEGATVTLVLGGQSWNVPVCGGTDAELSTTLPSGIDPNATYGLEVHNAAGGCSVSLPLARGVPGVSGMASCSGCIATSMVAATAVDATRLAPASVALAKLAPGVCAGSGAAATLARSDHAHPVATSSSDGLESAADFAKLALYSDRHDLRCQEEFDHIEEGTRIISYWPDAAKRADLYAHGWICWDRTDDKVKLDPLMPNVALAQYYSAWTTGAEKVCGRITWISGAADANRSFLALGQGSYYFGLRYLDGTTNTWHGRWNGGSGEGSGSVGLGDRWTIWTCR